MYNNDNRIVITLDAGGTNFVFGAIQGNKDIIPPFTLPSRADNLDTCMASLVEGFTQIISQLQEKPVAISFAFPGPADYPRGIIGGYLPNFPSFRDGVALGPFLEKKFGIPVFINNDGDLYAYGEALAGALPEINQKLQQAGSNKRYRNLIGYTIGTGFGIGIVIGGHLNLGDNSCVETWCLPNNQSPDFILEDGVSIRAVQRVYGDVSGDKKHTFTPKDIYDIAKGDKSGNQQAAIAAFEKMGEIAGYAMATTATLIDGLIVIGGGVSAAREFFMPALLREMRGKIHTMSGDEINRVQMKVYDLDDDTQFASFAQGESREINIYGSTDKVVYDPQKRIGVMTSRIGANRAISLGAYAFALHQIDTKR